VSQEFEFIGVLRALATHAGARGLADDAAVLEVGAVTLVLTKDMIVEGVHYRADDPPEDVAWKLVAVNFSDLAAKGARPVAVLLGFMLGDAAWDRRFAEGLGRALAAFGAALIGGDTVSAGAGRRALSLTAIGEAAGPVPARSGAAAGDAVWISGAIGDSGAGLAVLSGEIAGDDALVRRYRAPRPRLKAGQALAPLVSAMMDVSDGLLIDAARLGHASGVGITIELDQVPLSPNYLAALGGGRAARLRAASAGDDYELLFTAPARSGARIAQLAETLGLPLTRIGRCEAGAGLQLRDGDAPVPLPERLGYEHGAAEAGGAP
jgi:thiamine-monophosphate kinase